jgi:hypothetical protein
MRTPRNIVNAKNKVVPLRSLKNMSIPSAEHHRTMKLQRHLRESNKHECQKPR